jgi:mono/diheme cytochrome c family protein
MRAPASSTCALFAAGMLWGCGGAEAEAPEYEPPGGLAIVHPFDAAMAGAGHDAFASGVLRQGVIPVDAMRHLYLSWTDDLAALYVHYSDADAYWQAFAERYGTVASPFAGATYPAGFGVAENGLVGIDCMLCHAGRVGDATVIGRSNQRLDLRAFVEDLQRLPGAIQALKMRELPEPYATLVQTIPDTVVPEPYASIDIPTAAAGANDGFGLGFVTSVAYGDPPPDLRTFMGYQDAPAWWTIKHKQRLYSDASAPAEGNYTMMSTLLAFGLTLPELAAYRPTFDAIQQYLYSLPAPRWSEHGLPSVDDDVAARGSELFATRCAGCHGNYHGGVFPNAVLGDLGTDRLRVDQFGPTEAAWFNGFIPETAHQMQDSDGYLAPALSGVWASAPYFHNGSVPTLRALLDPSQRPVRWRITSDAIDSRSVGLTHEVVDAPTDRDTVEGRKVVDTTVPGMSNSGHDLGLAPEEIDALLEFLKTL